MARWLKAGMGDDKSDFVGGGLVVVATVATCTTLWMIGM